MGAALQITDRALRYRANAAMPNVEKRCALCGNPGRVEVGHVDGHEENTSPENLFYTCRPCNVLAANHMRRNGAGRLTRQYNPEGARTLGQWLTAVTSMKGESDAMSVHDAVAMIHATPHSDRSEFAREIWSRRRASNPGFLPKSLFDRYTIRDKTAGEDLQTNIQTLAGAKHAVKKFGKKHPCSALAIVSDKFGEVESYKPANGRELKVDQDNSRDYKRKATEEAKKNVRYELYIGGVLHDTYDTRKEAESFAKDKRVTDGKAWKVKEVAGNPANTNYAAVLSVAVKRKFGPNADISKIAQASTGRAVMEKAGRLKEWYGRVAQAAIDSGLTKIEIIRLTNTRHGIVNPLTKFRVTYRGKSFDVLAASREDAERQVRAIWKGEAVVNPEGRNSGTYQQRTYQQGKRKPSQGKMIRPPGQRSAAYQAGLTLGIKDRRAGKSAQSDWGHDSVGAQRYTAKKDIDDFNSAYDAAYYERGLTGPRGRLPNPDNDTADAEALYEAFHGVPSTGETVYEEVHEVPDAFAELGQLIELKVATIHGKDITIAAPDPENGDLSQVVKLASTPDGRQLYFIGGDQALDLNAMGFTESEERHRMLIGVLYELTYRTKKAFHKLKTTDYYHQLGEDTKNQPMLVYNPYSERMGVVGGDYHVRPEGIVN